MKNKAKKGITQIANMKYRDSDYTFILETLTGWIIVLTVIFIPIIIWLHLGVFISPQILFDKLNTGIKPDIYVYYKWQVFIIAVGILIVLFILRTILKENTIKASYINLPILIITILSLISLSLASFKNIAMLGGPEFYEGTLTFLIYITIMFITANTQFNDKQKKGILIGIGVVIFINVFFIIMSFSGYNIGEKLMSQFFIVNGKAFSLKGTGVIRSTLYNQNYVSGFVASLAMLYLVLALITSNYKLKLFSAITATLAFFLCISALSSSGFMIIYLLVPLILVSTSWLRNFKKVSKTFMVIFCIWLTIFIGISIYQPKVLRESNIMGTINMHWNSNDINQTTAKNGTNDWPGKEFGLPKPGLAIGNGRLYIWRETARLILEKPLQGYGADTLGYYFPQSDINKTANLGTYTSIVSKPHCFYLAVAFNYGIPALLALLALFFMHFIKTINFILAHKDHEVTPIIMALFVFWLGFLLQWLVNDSFVGTSAVFWILFGMAISLMREAEEAETKRVVTRVRA